MVVGGQYNESGGSSDSPFSLLKMLCHSQVFYFGNSETVRFI